MIEETISTRYKKSHRLQLKAALAALDKGDEIVLTKLDRLGRKQVEFVSLLHKLQQEGKHARTLDGLINTRGLRSFSPVLMGVLTGLSEVQRTPLQERTKESIAFRRETEGNLVGRPKTNEAKEGLVTHLRNEGCSYRSIRSQTVLHYQPFAESFLIRRLRNGLGD